MAITPRTGPKQVLRGYIQMAAGEAIKSATITAVNPARAELRLLGAACDIEFEVTEW